MADSKKYDGSQWEHSLRKLTTATDTISTLPADLYTDGNNATVGLVGNMSQLGTPTPQNPIQPSECGDRTENLFDGDYENAYLTGTGLYVTPDTTTKSIIVKCEPNTTYTIKQVDYAETRHKWRIAVFDSIPSNNAQGTLLVDDDSLSESTITTLADSAYIVVYYAYPPPLTNAKFMINLGSTALPYQPYGYKLGIKSGSTTTPVYLGWVQSTRIIGKYEFTGDENWVLTSSGYFYSTNAITDYNVLLYNVISIRCSHYEPRANSTSGAFLNNNQTCLYCSPTQTNPREVYIRDNGFSTADDFKTYLAQQYANGTPVTVWYVLANPTTGIVNEPLRKIGNYADSVSVTGIPTTAGGIEFDVDTTLKPSEVDLTYHGWHDASAKECVNGQWE